MTATLRNPLVVLAAGGTGGHVFPADALAAALLERGCELSLFTDARGRGYGGTLGRIAVHPLAAAGIAGRGVLSRLAAMGALGLGTVQAWRLLGRLKPAVVVGFGGYASVPGMAGAVLRGIPTVIHEQNAVLGRANRLLAGRVSRLATAFAEVAALPRGTLAVRVGMPVRPAIAALAGRPFPTPAADGPIGILVLGGSQGATALSEVVPRALAALPAALKSRIRLSQQCRPADIAGVRAAYENSGIAVELATFFDDVPERLERTHLAIARAGASTVAELTAAGRPAILVPYPHATDDHQSANARAVAAAGGAWVMPQTAFTPEALSARLADLLADPAALADAARCAGAFGIPDAAGRLADLVCSLIPGFSQARPEAAP